MRPTPSPEPGPRRCHRGFTLIELMITVAVVALLAAVAMPSFLDSIRKGRRSEAFTALAAVQQAQERWRSTKPDYTATLSDLGATSPTRPGGYYTLTLGSNTATGYIATADGSSSGQAADGQCAKLSVKVEAGAITYASCTGCTTFTYADNDLCWKR